MGTSLISYQPDKVPSGLATNLIYRVQTLAWMAIALGMNLSST